MYKINNSYLANPALTEALVMLEVARNHFNYADSEMIDAAIFDLAAAELHLRATLKKAREGSPLFINPPIEEPDVYIPLAHPSPQMKQIENER